MKIMKKIIFPFMVNNAISYYMDCILFANEMNMNAHLEKRMHYDYLFHSLRKMKRQYVTWVKNKKVMMLMLLLNFWYSNNVPKKH